MDAIQFSLKDYTVQYHDKTITLLPKEYQLLIYLYQSPSIVFSREQLLQAVWPNDFPVDRTVDDHIYRIRKKLMPLGDVVTIETVRGQGYVLIIKVPQNSPLMHDEQIAMNMQQLFSKYHQYGQGDALKLLEQNQQLLGFEMNTSNILYLQFMQGNFKWFLQAPYPFHKKAFYMMHAYALYERDKTKCLQLFEQALTHIDLPEMYKLEIRLLNINLLLIFTGQLEQAYVQIQAAKDEIYANNYEGFIPLVLLTDATLALAQNDELRITALIEEIHQVLVRYPFLREHAHFLFIQGLAELRHNEALAHKYFSEGFHLLQQSQFVPGLLMNCSLILFFIDHFQLSTSLKQTFEQQLDEFINLYDLKATHTELSQIFSLDL